MDRTSLTFRALKNAFYSLFGYMWPIVLAIFVTPIIVFTLGIKDYGIYLFVNTLISLFGLLDFGLGMAVTKHMSYYYGQKNEGAMKTLTHSANSLFLIVSSIGLILSAIIAFLGTTLLPDKFASYEQYSLLFLIGGAIFFVSTVNLTYSAILVALQRFDINTKIGIASLTLSSLSILAVVRLGGSLQAVFLTQLVINIIFAFVIFYQARKILPPATFGFGWNKPEIKHCYSFGLVSTINSVAGSALSYLDRLIIPFFAGPTNLTYYSLPGNVTTKIPGISSTLGSTVFPMTSELHGGESQEKIERLYVRSIRLITIIAASLTITCMAFSYKILFIWLSADFAEKSSKVLVVLALTNFFLALFAPLSGFLLGLGRLKFLTYNSIAMAVLNGIFLFLLLPPYGIIGAAWAYFLSVLPVIFMFYYSEKKYFRLSNRRKYYFRKIPSIALVSIIVFLTDFYLMNNLITNLPTLLIAGLVSTILFIVLYKIFGFFEHEDWRDIEYFFLEGAKRLNMERFLKIQTGNE